jgi:DNA polymerase III subunit gamma/tau
MSYLVLARKWRPRTFDEVVGQSTVTRTLKNALASGRVGHAFLLSGARGVGKTTTARILAKALNCEKGPTPEPCGECPSCVEIAAGNSLDVQEIDGATHNGVEQVRELRESARYNPARDRFKIWIIDEVHMLSTGAFNALLKTLEEPPPRVKFIFATTEYHKLPDTILSRCQQYDFRMIPARELVTHLRAVADGEAIKVSDEALARIARAAEGSARDALSLFDQVLSFSGQEVRDEDIGALLGLVDRELLLSASRATVNGDSLAVLELVERLAEYGADYRNFARELMLHFREILLLKLAPEASPLLAQVIPEERARLAPVVEGLAEEDVLRALDVLTRAETDLRWAQDPRVTLELALLKIVQMRRLLPFSELVDRVERLAVGAPAAAGSPSRAAALTPAPSGPSVRRIPSEPPPAPSPAIGTRSTGPVRPAMPSDTAVAVASPAAVTSSAAVTSPTPAVAPLALDGADSLLAAMASQSRPSLGQALRGARGRMESEGALLIEVAADFGTFAEMHLDEYRELARKAAGRPIQVRIVGGMGPVTAAAAVEAIVEGERQQAMERASREPAVQEVLDLFNGKVVDVRVSES